MKEMSNKARILNAAAGTWVFGGQDIGFTGNKRQVEVALKATIATRRFKDELERSGATTRSIMEALHRKHEASREFEREFGVKWLL